MHLGWCQEPPSSVSRSFVGTSSGISWGFVGASGRIWFNAVVRALKEPTTTLAGKPKSRKARNLKAPKFDPQNPRITKAQSLKATKLNSTKTGAHDYVFLVQSIIFVTIILIIQTIRNSFRCPPAAEICQVWDAATGFCVGVLDSYLHYTIVVLVVSAQFAFVTVEPPKP